MPFINKVIKDARPTLIEAEKANELIGYINGLLSSRGDDPIGVTIDDNGQMVISIEGYKEIEAILCRNGAPVDGFILFKEAAVEE